MCDSSVGARRRQYLQSGVVNDNFMESSLNEATGNMFQLFPGLHQEVTAGNGKLDGDAFPSVPCPDVESRVSRSPMDCQEVKVRVKARQDGVLLAVFDKVRCSWSKEVGSFCPSVSGDMNVEKDAHPYFPASEKVLVGIPRPVAIMSATSSTLECRQMTDDRRVTCY